MPDIRYSCLSDMHLGDGGARGKHTAAEFAGQDQ
jgi:hypothetical protein